MTEPRQKMIGVTPGEKAALDRAKAQYEESAQRKEDWGSFLSKAVILGLVAMGIYKMVKYDRDHPTVTCGLCGGEFPLPYSEDFPAVAYIDCPHCGEQLVVDYHDQESFE